MARLHLGHTRVTHSNILLGEKQPKCVGCDAPFTVHHFLLECGDFAQVRNKCFHVDSMKQLFQDIHTDSIMTFSKEINLFQQNLIAILVLFLYHLIKCYIFFIFLNSIIGP